MFGIDSPLPNVEKLVLRKVALHSMEQMAFANYPSFVYLDLSYNNLTQLVFDSFRNLNKLVSLDLSHNRISFIDGRIFSAVAALNTAEASQMKPLKYLNLEHNQLVSLDTTFINYRSVETFKMAFNFMSRLPIFDIKNIGSIAPHTRYIYLNNNNIKKLSVIRYMHVLTILNLDCNEIRLIEQNAMSELYGLQNVSMSHNYITEISANNFFTQFKLKYLNMSHNRISSIEMDSFRSLVNLKVLDLSFNRLKSIESNTWHGLRNLNDLHLMKASEFELELTNDSLNHLPQLNSLYLNESLILAYKCIFMDSVQREIQRNVSNGKIVFLKSLNLISAKDEHASLHA